MANSINFVILVGLDFVILVGLVVDKKITFAIH